MSDEACKKTFGELYAIQWQRDFNSLVGFPRDQVVQSISDKIGFAIQVGLAAAGVVETTIGPAFLASLSAEIGVASEAIAFVLR